MSDKSASLVTQHLFADVLARVHAVCARARGRGPMARRHRFLARRGRAAARCQPWRHGDQRRDGAGQGRQGKAARSRRADRGKAARRRSGRFRRGRRSRLHQSHPEAAGLAGRAAHRAARGRGLRQKRDRPRRQGQCRIRLGQSDRADACRPLPRRGVRRCAVRACSHFAGYDVTREYYINDAGAQVDVLARSAFLRYREALGEDIGEIPEGLYPGDYLDAGRAGARGRAWRQAQGDAGERLAADRARQGHRHDDGR